MDITLLKCKLHMCRVTATELTYDGSCAIDSSLVEMAGLREFEKIDIYNVNNGVRFHTYVILAEPGSGTISLNGAAARCAQPGDAIIIAAYQQCNEEETRGYKPKLIYLNSKNEVVRTSNQIEMQK